ncbi:hypothetical protein HanXRQr2_Chr17g0805231 [Helianthus annuus]|uniref:Uncharacterized protein n=1 Tax=Helianthus annuus TaxID=4232 RepID=A0A9K3DK64_HELAN|nr:hypothetical protein HanXRQr2_Chr17g0805231 [Helianthus annuus]KAJ0433797.1 hypothetical protein HanIR_Chr17g0874251 [Helianthus annuus]KAJ0813430.1 hypothetical protein HanPSC8_Chr17g0773331 [Helianthus annuus]
MTTRRYSLGYTSTKVGLWDGSNNLLERFTKTPCQKTPTKFHCIKSGSIKFIWTSLKQTGLLKEIIWGGPLFWDG